MVKGARNRIFRSDARGNLPVKITMNTPTDASVPSLAVIAPDAAASGEARQAFLHASMARHAGIACRVAAPEASWLARQCRASGIDFIPITSGFASGNGGRILSQSLKASPPRVLHGFGVSGGLLAIRHRKSVGGAAVVSVFETAELRGLAKANHVLAADSACVAALHQAGLDASRVTLHGLAAPDQRKLGQHNRTTARAALRLGEEHIALLVPGPLHADLGQDTLLDAIDAIADHRLRVFLPGTKESEFGRRLHIQAAQMPAAAGGMIGRLDDPSLMQAFDACVAPIRRAHAAHHVLPALAAGLPVVCNPVGVLADLVVDGEQGMLTQRDDSAGLQKALTRMLLDVEEFSRMGRAASAAFQARASMRPASRRYVSLLRKLSVADAVT